MRLLTLLTLTAAATACLSVPAQAQKPKPAKTQKAGQRFQDCRDCPQMVVIPTGKFVMGAEAGEEGRYEGPEHAVAIARSFAIARDPITVAQFRTFVTATGYKAATDCIVPRNGTYEKVPGSDWRDPAMGRPPKDDEPVVCINWNDAQAYVKWLAKTSGKPYRMLTEAEWEYVAKDRKRTRFPWGDNPADACANANLMDASVPAAQRVEGAAQTCSDGYAALAPVGKFKANSFGVNEMVGNVWTWVQDCYVMPYPKDTPTDGSAYETPACERRSVRGASWGTNVTRARPTFRGRDPVDRLSGLFSLRVARDLP
jgi:formylglycine-generating enzyme required for sulfatase activity